MSKPSSRHTEEISTSDNSELVESHLPCPCGISSDAYASYTDGHGHCYSCGKTVPAEGDFPQTSKSKKEVRGLIPFDRYQPLSSRSVSQETCEKYGYFIGKDKGQSVQVAPYRKRGEIVAQKVRGPNKQFYTTGDFKGLELFGQHLFRNGGKRILIVEGEIDALSAYQMLGTWSVVSIPYGAAAAARAISDNIAFLESYEKVIFGFDMDEPGRKAVAECVQLLSPGKAAILSLPRKDANEMLVEGLVKEFVSAFWEAQEYRPDGIVRIGDIKERILTPPTLGLPWFLETLTKYTYGRRLGETYALGAGTGCGKTDLFTQQIQHDVDVLKEKVGLFFLEQPPDQTAKRVAGKFAGKRFHVPDGSWTQDELLAIIDRLAADDRLYFYDNFGATDWLVIKGVIKYLAQAHGVRLFYLDHLTALAAAEDNEKEALEKITADMALLAKSLNVIIHFISHLSTPEGKSHEEGGRVMTKHFKGSRAIGFWSHFMFGMERNTQAEDEAERSTTTFRILKDRNTGDSTGKVIFLGYDRSVGRLYETEPPEPDLLNDSASDY